MGQFFGKLFRFSLLFQEIIRRIKYCSTFDSTPEGNIGPVMDAVLEELDVPGSILCPALPENGRTVKNGILYVNGIPLAESSMKDHPLTPMWESRISRTVKAGIFGF